MKENETKDKTKTKDETKNPIDQPTIIKLKKKKIKKNPSSNKWKSKK